VEKARTRSRATALHQRVQLLPALFAQHFADQCAELMHVLAQREVLGWKLDLMAVHGCARF
jgi:hypothetical protein